MNEAGQALQNRLSASDGVDAVAVFEAWRRDFPTTTSVDASGLRLADCNLTGSDWTNVKLTGAVFTRCTIDGAKFSGDHCELLHAAFSGGSLKNAEFAGVDCRHLQVHALSMDSTTFRDCYLQNATFKTVSLAGVVFERCHLEGCEIDNCSADDKTRFTDSHSTHEMKVEQVFLDALSNGGGLSNGQLASIVITDEVAELKLGFGGAYAWVHVASLVVFVFPYVSFVANRLVMAAIRGTSEDDPMLVDALWRFILTGGDGWRETPVEIAWASFVPFLLVLGYNIGRVALLLTVFKFEHHEAVFRRRTRYKLAAYQRRIWTAVRYGFWINLLLVAVHTMTFLVLRVPG